LPNASCAVHVAVTMLPATIEVALSAVIGPFAFVTFALVVVPVVVEGGRLPGAPIATSTPLAQPIRACTPTLKELVLGESGPIEQVNVSSPSWTLACGSSPSRARLPFWRRWSSPA